MHQLVFDEIRKTWVVATPEERIRQQWIQRMIRELGYPKELLAVEKELSKMPHLSLGLPNRRADLVCFAKEIHRDYPLYPLLLMEYKETGLTQKAIDQVMGYNYYLKAYFVAIATANEIICFLKGDQSVHILPSYQELLEISRS